MRTRSDVIAFCKTFPAAYEDYPFHDPNWTVMRCRANKKAFAFIFEKESCIWVNVKTDPDWALFWRQTYPAVIPAYHMNKQHWNSIILNGTVPEKDLERMIAESYALVRPKQGTCAD